MEAPLQRAGCHDGIVGVVGAPKRHAYALVKGLDQDDLLLIDPEVMGLKSVTYDQLSAGYSLFVLFNDRTQAADKQQIGNLLMYGTDAVSADKFSLLRSAPGSV